jgi:hypothetical protein
MASRKRRRRAEKSLDPLAIRGLAVRRQEARRESTRGIPIAELDERFDSQE